jgi:anti-sigma regulatory factor (Ser/Thr protein kinase)
VRAECSFAPRLASAAEARQFVNAQLRSWECSDVAADAELAVSELAANAILHAESPFIVSLQWTGTQLRIEVSDHSSSVPVPAPFAAASRSGWGLMILDKVVDSWGVEALDGGKVVWAEINGMQRSSHFRAV